METPRCRQEKRFVFHWARIVTVVVGVGTCEAIFAATELKIEHTHSSKGPMHFSVILLFGRAFVFSSFSRITWHKWYQLWWRARNARRQQRQRLKEEFWTWEGYWARSKQLIGIAISISSVWTLFFSQAGDFDAPIRSHAVRRWYRDRNGKRHNTMTTSNMTQKIRGALIEAEIIPYLSHVIHSIISFR